MPSVWRDEAFAAGCERRWGAEAPQTQRLAFGVGWQTCAQSPEGEACAGACQRTRCRARRRQRHLRFVFRVDWQRRAAQGLAPADEPLAACALFVHACRAVLVALLACESSAAAGAGHAAVQLRCRHRSNQFESSRQTKMHTRVLLCQDTTRQTHAPVPVIQRTFVCSQRGSVVARCLPVTPAPVVFFARRMAPVRRIADARAASFDVSSQGVGPRLS